MSESLPDIRAKQQAVERYIRNGWAVIPVQSGAKNPGRDGWQHERHPVEAVPELWPNGENVGAILGEASGGLVDVDLDTHEARAVARHILPRTRTSGRASSPASHWWYLTDPIPTTKRYQTNGRDKKRQTVVELRSTGGQTIIPTSTHPSGELIAWTNEAVEVARVDGEELRQAVEDVATAALVVRYWPGPGARHDYALAVAGYIGRRLPRQRVERITRGAIAASGDEDREDRERAVSDTLDRLARGENVTGGPTLDDLAPGLVEQLGRWHKWTASEYRTATLAPSTNGAEDQDQASAPGYELTDLGNAYRFVRHADGCVRYIAPWSDWLYFDGTRWVHGAELKAMRVAHGTAREIHAEAATETDLDRQRALGKFALASQNDARIKAMLSGARAYLEIGVEDLDADPYALNTPNGTVDLHTGESHAHRREDHITKLTGVSYDADASAPTFDAFLTRILPSEPVRRFVQKVMGYAACGATTEEVLVILWGKGANGKTTLINVVMEALGDYAMQAAPDLLMAKKGSHPTELADLFRARFVASTEVEEGRRFDEALVKSITGRDTIKARRMRQDFWQFTPTHTVFLSTNHRPEVRGTDLGIWRRLRPIPFEVTIPEAEQDHALPQKLRDELPGILRWIVEGCLLWQAEGLIAPAEVTQAAEDYREDMDVLAPFIDEWCVVHPSAQAGATPLYEAYTAWCIEAGERVESRKKFVARLSERGFTREKVGGSYRWYGIGISTLGPGPSNQDRNGPAPGPRSGDGPANESPIPTPNDAYENAEQDHQDQESGLTARSNLAYGVNTKHGPVGPNGPDSPTEPVERKRRWIS